jgi:hypothetical protein
MRGRYALYTNSVVNHFLPDVDKQAMVITKTATAPTGFLSSFDKLTQFAKSNMLGTNLHWLNNVFYHSAAKGFIDGGFAPLFNGTKNLVKNALGDNVPGLKFLQDELTKNMGKVTSNEMRMADIGKDAYDLHIRGGLGSELFEVTNDPMVEGILKDNKSLSQAMVEASDDWVKQAKKGTGDQTFDLTKLFQGTKDGVVDGGKLIYGAYNRYKDAVFKTGHYMESQYRVATYQSMLNTLKSDPAMASKYTLEAMKDMSADYVKKVYFDYSAVNTFEREFMKRMVPFYTFFANNTQYFANKFFDPQTLPVLHAMSNPFREYGEPLSPDEHDGLSSYIKENLPRRLGKDDLGNIVYGIAPAMPMFEAIKTLGAFVSLAKGGNAEVIKEILSKANPLLTMPAEMSSPLFVWAKPGGTDFFTLDHHTVKLPDELKEQYGKDEIEHWVSSNPMYGSIEHPKQLWSSGVKYWMMKEFIDGHLGEGSFDKWAEKVMGGSIYLDEKGHIKDTSGWISAIEKIQNTLLPAGSLDKLAQTILRSRMGKNDYMDEIQDLLLPIKHVKVNPNLAQFTNERELMNLYKEYKKDVRGEAIGREKLQPSLDYQKEYYKKQGIK